MVSVSLIHACKTSAVHYSTCQKISTPLVCLILDQSETYIPEVMAAQTRLKNDACMLNRQHEEQTVSNLKENLATKKAEESPNCLLWERCSSWLSALYPSLNMVLPCIEGPSGMLCAYAIVGNQYIYHPSVSVASILPLSMHLAAQEADFLPSSTMKSVTS